MQEPESPLTEVNLKFLKEEGILDSSMPDNLSYAAGDKNDGKYRTFDDIPRETSTSKQESIVEGNSKTLTRFPRGPAPASRKDCTRFFGLLLAFLSGVMMTTYSSLIKTLEEMDVMQVVVIRGLLQVSVMGGLGKSDQTN